jgi:hypothetical protein
MVSLLPLLILYHQDKQPLLRTPCHLPTDGFNPVTPYEPYRHIVLLLVAHTCPASFPGNSPANLPPNFPAGTRWLQMGLRTNLKI